MEYHATWNEQTINTENHIDKFKNMLNVEGWGEKAYNCNWITIKIKKYIFILKNMLNESIQKST